MRAQLFDRRPPRYRGYTAWRGVAQSGVPGVDQASEFWGRGERFGVLPVRDGRVAWYASANAPAASGDATGPAAALFERFGGWISPVPAVLAATPEETIVKNDVYDRTPIRRWVVGRVALLGDAAHPMTPDLGQGGCQAIVDAWALADSLAMADDRSAGATEQTERQSECNEARAPNRRQRAGLDRPVLAEAGAASASSKPFIGVELSEGQRRWGGVVARRYPSLPTVRPAGRSCTSGPRRD